MLLHSFDKYVHPHSLNMFSNEFGSSKIADIKLSHDSIGR